MAEDGNEGAAFMVLEPRDRLDFRRPFNQVVKTMLRVTNTDPEDSIGALP